MSKLLISTFTSSDDAELAIQKLSSRGLDPKTMSVITHDKKKSEEIATNTGSSVMSGAKDGAITGAAVGAAAGLLIGLGAIAIPGIGGLLVAGPIATAFGLTGAAATTTTGAVAGGVIGGLAGALVNLGLPSEEAKQYETDVNGGATLVIVPLHDDDVVEAETYMKSLGADKTKIISTNTTEDHTNHENMKTLPTNDFEHIPRMTSTGSM